MTALGRLSDPNQFEEIIVKVGEDGGLTYLRDIARVELGAQSYDTFAQKGGENSASVLIYQLPGANALNVAEGVKQAVADLSQSFPKGLKYDIPFDTTIFVSSAIYEVYKTLFEAGVLVLIVNVENASHHIERGESPKDATIRAMREVTGPVIGILCIWCWRFCMRAGCCRSQSFWWYHWDCWAQSRQFH